MNDLSQITDEQWRTMSSPQIGALVDRSKQAVYAYRKRHNKPASPSGHGGHRHGIIAETMRITVPRSAARELKRLAKLPVERLKKFK